MGDDDGDSPTCQQCGEPRPPGGLYCPPCEDLQAATVQFEYPPGVTSRHPPHGNTTR